MKAIPGFEGLYAVTKNGRVWTYARKAKGAVKYHIKGRFLTPQTGSRGYLHVNLVKDGKIYIFNVHRLVATTFLSNPTNLAQINHKNGIKSDNRAHNLEWCTPKQNIIHGVETGLIPRGERHGMAKLTESNVVRIRKLHSQGNLNYREIGSFFGVTGDLVSLIVRGRIWKHVPNRAA
jgi:hypothetical protein